MITVGGHTMLHPPEDMHVDVNQPGDDIQPDTSMLFRARLAAMLFSTAAILPPWIATLRTSFTVIRGSITCPPLRIRS